MNHIRVLHFRVPRTLKRQLELNGELDKRDPNDFVRFVSINNEDDKVDDNSRTCEDFEIEDNDNDESERMNLGEETEDSEVPFMTLVNKGKKAQEIIGKLCIL